MSSRWSWRCAVHEDDWLEEAFEDRMSQSYTSDPDDWEEDDQPFFGEDMEEDEDDG